MVPSKRVIVYQQVIPHYRKRLFETLSEDSSYNFFLVADLQSDSLFLRPAVLELGARFLQAETKKLRLAGHTFLWQPRVFRHLRTIQPNIIVALGNPNSITSWGILLYGLLTSTRVLLWTHGLLRNESGPKWWLRKLFYTLADGLLLYGERAKDLLIGKGLDGRKLFVIYNSLDFYEQQKLLNDISKDEVDAFRTRIGVADGDRIVVFSGRLQANKKLSYLVKAVGILRQRNRVVHVAFIGDGDESATLAKLAKRVGILSQIHFLGESYDERFLAQVFMSSDLSVIPSGAGLSVIHALGYGVPVLLHDRPEEHGPEWEAVREGETGFFYRYGDINDMADKIEDALFPTSQKERMKEACLAVIRNRYNTAAHAGAIISAVNQIVEQKR
jgi:glycosyltransferase involved in cell wall biosynthesis